MTLTTNNRWLRFNFDDPNHKSLKILGGTSFVLGEDKIVSFDEDTILDFSNYISEEGCDYYIFVNADKRVVASTLRDAPDGYMFIGQFHTLCADVGDNVTAINSVGQVAKQVGDTVTLQNYFKEKDLDFYNFYTKEIISIYNGSYYNVATIIHPLSGFKAMDILPESVWCLNFHPSSKNWDGMVWCNGANICVDIYLQSGTGEATRSEYGAVHTVNRQWLNYRGDMQTVGKHICYVSEFLVFAEGSNERTGIQGGAEANVTTGGHVDTVGRRMISFIGCEECCGYIWQDSGDVADSNDNVSWRNDDGEGLMGQSGQAITFPVVGGTARFEYHCGSRCLDGSELNEHFDEIGTRGCCDIAIV